MPALFLDGGFAGSQLPGDLLVEQTGNSGAHHVLLAGSQQIIPATKLGELQPLRAGDAITIDRVANAAYQKVRGRQSRRAEVSLDDVLPLFDERGQHVAPMADWSSRVDDHAVQIDLRMALTSAIDKLPADYRTAVLLRDVEGLSHLQIAEVLSLSVPTVKSRVHRARLFLRKELGDTMTTLGTPAEA